MRINTERRFMVFIFIIIISGCCGFLVWFWAVIMNGGRRRFWFWERWNGIVLRCANELE